MRSIFMVALSGLRGIVVIDEIQRRLELFPVLRVLADRRPLPARFLVLGSASQALLRQSSESLAGRIDRIPSSAMQRFWAMLAHLNGRIWNAANPARSLGISEPTVRRYLDVLTDLFLVRQLQPFHANVAKRQVKSPKVFVRDSGLLHELLGIRTESDLLSHPLSGASWEGYVIEQFLALVKPDEAYFWATYQGAELDLLCIAGGRRIGVEVKRADAPSLTPSMRIARETLQLDAILVLYPGDREYALADDIVVRPVSSLSDRSFPLPVRKRQRRAR